MLLNTEIRPCLYASRIGPVYIPFEPPTSSSLLVPGSADQFASQCPRPNRLVFPAPETYPVPPPVLGRHPLIPLLRVWAHLALFSLSCFRPRMGPVLTRRLGLETVPLSFALRSFDSVAPANLPWHSYHSLLAQWDRWCRYKEEDGAGHCNELLDELELREVSILRRMAKK